MRPKKYQVYLSTADRQELERLTKRVRHSAATIKRANILLDLDENTGAVGKQEEIAGRFQTSTVTIYNVSKQFVEEGFSATLYRKKREVPPIHPIATARIISLACSELPKGRSRWTLRLLEEKVIELQIVEAISDNTIGRLLKKRRLSLI